jgi:DNA-binding response OmpR family regulator
MSSRILVVEDEAQIADFLVRGLREEGYHVEYAADGRAARLMLQTTKWDLVVLDWWLPGEDGVSVLRHFRQSDRTTPVLFLTARDTISSRVEGLDSGADDYLCKPFSFEELLARIRALLRRPSQSSSTQLDYADIHADLETQSATRGGQPLHLTAKEFSLLVLFLRQPGRVLSRTRIYESVWEEQYDGLSNTLEVHINQLRRKLESHGGRVIHTRRGRGYVLTNEHDEEGGGEQ